MIYRFLGFLALIILVACQRQEAHPGPSATTDLHALIVDGSAGYDSLFSTHFQADEYGMQTYVMAFLKSGPNRSQDPEEAAALQKAHLDNITRLADEGKLVVAGPFLDEGPIRGIYLFNVKTVEEARALTESDPAIQAGRLEMELHPWYGSAALNVLNPLHKRLQQKNITD